MLRWLGVFLLVIVLVAAPNGLGICMPNSAGIDNTPSSGLWFRKSPTHWLGWRRSLGTILWLAYALGLWWNCKAAVTPRATAAAGAYAPAPVARLFATPPPGLATGTTPPGLVPLSMARSSAVSLSVIYVRVSTEDQVDFSPDAQARRCKDYGRQHDLGPFVVIVDPGFTGSTLKRPGMQELLELVEAGRVAHVIVWRLDRLSRDTGDQSYLVRLFGRLGVRLHSVNDGVIDLDTASGRLHVGFHGVLAQYYREQLIENVRMGMEQAARKGRWLNRAPTGYDMVNGELVPNEVAPLVGRIFALRACGASYPAIEREVGICYSTVRQIVHNRVYLGEVRLRDQWFPGNHPALVTREKFDAAHRGHVPGRRRGRDLLHGRVRCGLCGRRIGPDTNERGQMLYRCWHRGKGCKQPGRSANGLQRAAVLGLRELASNMELQEAIREELGRHVRQEASAIGPNRQASITALMTKRNKLLQLHYDDRITAEAFSQEESRLTAQIESLRSEEAQIQAERMLRDDLATRYSEVEELLARIDIEAAWEAATPAERRVLIEELVEAVVVFPDHLEVQVAGAPPLNVTLAEVGLRERGTEPVVSEGDLNYDGNGAGR